MLRLESVDKTFTKILTPVLYKFKYKNFMKNSIKDSNGEQKKQEDANSVPSEGSSDINLNPKLSSLCMINGEILFHCQNGEDGIFCSTKGDIIVPGTFIEQNAGKNNLLENLRTNRTKKNDIVKSLNSIYEKYIYSDDKKNYTMVSCFTILSYGIDLFESIPYLHLKAEKGSGKTTLIKVMKELVYNPKLYTDMTPATLFRIIDKTKPTLLIDEADSLESRNSANKPILQILNSGYKKGAVVPRTYGNGEVLEYNTYSLKIIAGTGDLHHITADRCIQISIQKADQDQFNSLSAFNSDTFPKGIIEQIVTSLANKQSKIKSLINNPDQLSIDKSLINRIKEKWFPILLIAKIFSTDKDDYFKQMHELALSALQEQNEIENNSPGNICQGIIQDYITDRQSKTLLPEDQNYFYFKTDNVQEYLKNHDTNNYYRNKSEVTLLLRTIGIMTDRRRVEGQVTSMYKIPRSFGKKDNAA